MSIFAEAFLPQMINGVAAIRGPLEPRPLTELVTSARSAYEVAFDNTQKTFSLDFRVGDQVVAAIASDCCRLSTSAMQSLTSITAEISEKNSMPWALVKLYYAAFYAAHALNRLTGCGCIWLDKLHVKRILEVGAVYGAVPAFAVERGYYRLDISQSGAQMMAAKIGAGGVHELFWLEFVRCTRLLSGRILSSAIPTADSQQVFAKLADLDRHFSANGSSWLAKTRNELQYQHAYEVWYKCGIRKRDREVLARFASKWNSNPMEVDIHLDHGLLGNFVTTCTFIVAACNSVVREIVRVTPKNSRSFAEFGPAAYLNEYALANAT